MLNTVFTLLLHVAEPYAIATLFLSYFQTLKIRDRTPVSLTPIPVEDWLKVDIYIPTYNEDVEIVRKTVLGAIAIDYPAAKKKVYVLDDGRAENTKPVALYFRECAMNWWDCDGNGDGGLLCVAAAALARL